MNCPRCQTPYQPGSRFCGYCGHSLAEGRPGPGPGADPGSAPGPVPGPPEPELFTPVGLPTGAARPPGAFALGRPGGFWMRLAAYIIDSLATLLIFVLFWTVILSQPLPGFTGDWEESPAETDFWADYEASIQNFQDNPWSVFLYLIPLVYDTALISLWATTLGKRAFGLYVVRTDGSRVGPLRALSRHLLTALSANFTLGLIFLVVAFREDKRGLHDLICDTVVIRRYR